MANTPGGWAPTPNVPSRPNMGSRTPSLPGALVAGASFQNGRYHVLGPYRPVQPLENRVPGYLAQWGAVDSSRRGDRVTLMELTFGEMVPALLERARETLANRLMVLNQIPMMQHIWGSFSERGRHFLVLEYIDGTFLSDRVARYGPLSERLTLALGDELLTGLAMLERQSPQILHGHIAPESIIMSPDGFHARLLCPSPALLAQSLSMKYVDPPAAPGFLAPEQLHGQPDIRSDLFSLGATLYFAATSFDAAARSATIFSPARQVNAAISPPMEAVLAKSVRQVASQRYQYAEEMQLDIERASHGEMPTRDPMDQFEPLIPRARSRSGAIAASGILSIVLVTLLLGLLVVHGHSTQNTNESVAPGVTVNPTEAALAAKGEGLSAGTIITDTSALGPNAQAVNMCLPGATVSTAADPTQPGPANAVVAEELGAKALCVKDFGSAIQDFQQAVQDDPSNAEALIYLANARIANTLANAQANHQPLPIVISIDVAVNFGYAPDSLVSREVLRGAAIAQHDLSLLGTLPGNALVRIEIANVGSSQTDEGAAALADYYAKLLQNGNPNHELGVVSWASPYITQASAANLLTALSQLQQANVPVVVPVTTIDSFPPKPLPNYFQLTANDQYQAGIMVNTALSAPFNAYRVVVVQGQALAANQEVAGIAKVIAVQKLGASNVISDTLSNTVTTATVVHDAETHGANMILFAGSSDQALQLTLALAKANYPVPIIASANADDPSLIGQGLNTVDAQLAAANPQAMQLLHIVALADAGEWSVLPQAKAQGFTPPVFFGEFGQTFTGPQGQPLTPSANAIFSYDAVTLMAEAPVQSGVFTAKQLPTPLQVTDALAQVNDAHPFQGVSGRIAFGTGGVPDNRSLVLKGITVSSNTDANGNHLLAWQIENIYPTFCANATCAFGFGG